MQATMPGQVPVSPPAHKHRRRRRKQESSCFEGADKKFELDDQIAEIQDFDLFDSDGSGSIDRAELKVRPSPWRASRAFPRTAAPACHRHPFLPTARVWQVAMRSLGFEPKAHEVSSSPPCWTMAHGGHSGIHA